MSKLSSATNFFSRAFSSCRNLARKIGHILANKRQTANLHKALEQDNTVKAEAPVALARRILVVEDNADALDMLCELLKMLGHEVHGVSNGEQATVALDDQNFDTLLIDIGLPGMSGLELAVQAKRRQSDLKIIFSSGYGAVEDLGFQASSLPKPYDLTQLQNILE